MRNLDSIPGAQESQEEFVEWRTIYQKVEIHSYRTRLHSRGNSATHCKAIFTLGNRIFFGLIMARCEFIYIRSRDVHVSGGQCENEAEFVQHRFCNVHRQRQTAPSDPITFEPQFVQASTVNHFPRVSSKEEIKEWVDEARKRTSPIENRRRGCVICGRASVSKDMVPITVSDLIGLRERMSDILMHHFGRLDPSLFQYRGHLALASGLPIDKNGLLSAQELVIGSPVIAQSCRECYTAIHKGRVPYFGLCNGLWTGIDVVTPLSDLTWIEEKLIARVHMSVQIQKCRMFKVWVRRRFPPTATNSRSHLKLSDRANSPTTQAT